MTTQATPTYKLEALIVRAFEAARDRGREDWRRMRLAVLKNRMLQLSGRTFSEQRHAATSLRELLGRHPELVRLRPDDDSVELLETDASRRFATPPASPAQPDLKHQRVRADLWDAIVDYSSGRKYAWDSVTQRAREAVSGDALVLPTLQPSEISEWRRAFRAEEGPAVPDTWQDGGMGTRGLPPDLRGKWNGFVKARVVRRLQSWFEANDITASVTVLRSSAKPPAGEAETATLEELRRVVSSCVAVMTTEELGEVRIPASVIARARLLPR